MERQKKLNVLINNFNKLNEDEKDYIRELTRNLADIHNKTETKKKSRLGKKEMFMKKIVLLIVAGFLLSGNLAAQNDNPVVGQVWYVDTNNPLEIKSYLGFFAPTIGHLDKDVPVTIMRINNNRRSVQIKHDSSDGRTSLIGWTQIVNLTRTPPRQAVAPPAPTPPTPTPPEQPRNTPPPAAQSNLRAVNNEILGYIDQIDRRGLQLFLSSEFKATIREEEARAVPVASGNGITINPPPPPPIQEINFTPSHIGVITTLPNDPNNRSRNFVVRFNGMDLHFKLRGDSYELDASLGDIERYNVTTTSREHPRLMVNFTNNDRRERPISSVAASNTPSQSSNVSAPPRNNTQMQHSGRGGSVNLSIIGAGVSNEDNVLAYVKRNKPSNRPLQLSDEAIKSLIGLYISEAAMEGINHDIAIAQMLHITQFLTNRTIVTSTFNYGGLNSTNRWNGRFNDRNVGVRAHIQHLRGYTRGSLSGRNQNVNPRWEVIANIRGTIHTVEDLYPRWSPHNTVEYRNSINSILRGLRG
ncbi:MAG: glucosaminidase domain-containing protein [Treponema sp.]|nr:glucosaminidase domain-containing protein [Treponema sp.]